MTSLPCCDRCTHSAQDPCPDFVPCITAGPLCHDDPDCTERRRQWTAARRRERLTRPVISIGTGTCGLGAGAAKTMTAIRHHLQQQNIDADIVEVGCIGLCAAEPLIDVQLPGRTRVAFANIHAEDVPVVLDSILAGTIPEDHVLGQVREASDSLDPWPAVPYLDEHPFFAPQTRWVLANCGVIDPRSLDEYIVRGGYTALSHALRDMTPEEVCAAVDASGLRGRGGGGFPTGRKWRFALTTCADQKYMVCNADEGDPGAFMDRAVIEGDPHRLLEGMAVAAYAIGATKAYIYIRAEYPLAIRQLQEAMRQAVINRLEPLETSTTK